MSAGSINHLRLSVGDIAECEAFYDPLLTLLGYAQLPRDDDGRAWGRGDPTAGVQWLILSPAAAVHRHTPHDLTAPGFHHLAFNAESRAQVNAVYEIVRRCGAEILDPPAEYDYEPGYYAVFFLDPNGLKLEVVHIPQPTPLQSATHESTKERRRSAVGDRGGPQLPGGRVVWIVGSPCRIHTSGLLTGMKDRSPQRQRRIAVPRRQRELTAFAIT